MAEEGYLSKLHIRRRLSLHHPIPQGSCMTHTQHGIAITRRRTMPAAGTVTWRLACPASWQKAWQVTSVDPRLSFLAVCMLHSALLARYMLTVHRDNRMAARLARQLRNGMAGNDPLPTCSRLHSCHTLYGAFLFCSI